MTINSIFELGDKVQIKDHKIKGVVNSIWVNRSAKNIQYEIECKSAGDVLNYRYFSENELIRRK